ncbi:MAG: hypothetical protein ACKVK3_07655 [Acidimicrobiales bacterium]|jgi:hypothetical protein|tara:strand:- start:224 stop:385 length:162 start_codon:yes stop_codon:yes gene_type:complete
MWERSSYHPGWGALSAAGPQQVGSADYCSAVFWSSNEKFLENPAPLFYRLLVA